jgi:hypothetical protein
MQAHVLPYGEVKLNMTKRIALTPAQTGETNAESSRAAGRPGRRAADLGRLVTWCRVR